MASNHLLLSPPLLSPFRPLPLLTGRGSCPRGYGFHQGAHRRPALRLRQRHRRGVKTLHACNSLVSPAHLFACIGEVLYMHAVYLHLFSSSLILVPTPTPLMAASCRCSRQSTRWPPTSLPSLPSPPPPPPPPTPSPPSTRHRRPCRHHPRPSPRKLHALSL